MSSHSHNRIQKYFRKRKIKKCEVIRVIRASMEKQANLLNNTEQTNSTSKTENYENDFYTTGRIGRRNALADILSYNNTAPASATTADLTQRLTELTVAQPQSDSDLHLTASTSNQNAT